jgi:hypothetical protein
VAHAGPGLPDPIVSPLARLRSARTIPTLGRARWTLGERHHGAVEADAVSRPSRVLCAANRGAVGGAAGSNNLQRATAADGETVDCEIQCRRAEIDGSECRTAERDRALREGKAGRDGAGGGGGAAGIRAQIQRGRGIRRIQPEQQADLVDRPAERDLERNFTGSRRSGIEQYIARQGLEEGRTDREAAGIGGGAERGGDPVVGCRERRRTAGLSREIVGCLDASIPAAKVVPLAMPPDPTVWVPPASISALPTTPATSWNPPLTTALKSLPPARTVSQPLLPLPQGGVLQQPLSGDRAGVPSVHNPEPPRHYPHDLQ